MPSCSLPNLAFWKSSPFKSSAGATAAGIPERPSALASRPGMSAPGAGYAAGSTTAPPYLGNTTGTTATGSYPTTPYSATPSAPYASSGATVSSSPPYVAPQVGAYGAGNSTSPGRTSPYANTSPYSAATATPYGPLGSSRETTGNRNYARATTTEPYANWSTTTPQSARAPANYSGRLDRFSSSSDRNTSSLPRNSSGFERSGSGVTPYGARTASSTAPLAGSATTGGQYGPSAPASGYGGNTASPYASGTPYSGSLPQAANPLDSTPASNPLDRYPSVTPGAGSTTGSGYSLPSAASQRSGYPSAAAPAGGSTLSGSDYTPGRTGYTPGATSYTPGDTGYTPPGVSPYRLPSGSSTLPARNSADPPPYRPGSSTDYVPRTPSGTAAGSGASGYSSEVPGARSGVAPANYALPAGGGLR
jgi:hypothetical protein